MSGNKKILIVEDDASICGLYLTTLSSDYNVECATDGEEGLKKAQEGGFDLILLDVMLPKIDGFGILAQLKKSPPQTPNGKIILLTNLTREPILQQAKDLGVTECITKVNLDPGQLSDKVKSFLGS